MWITRRLRSVTALPSFRKAERMTDAAAAFFEDLEQRGHEPLLAKVVGTVRVDLVDGDHIDPWLLTIEKGDLAVSHQDTKADCTFRADKAWFERLVVGEENAMAAVLRGAVLIEGDLDLLVAVQRLFPGPRSQQSRPASGNNEP
jgi:putative sterol carrier protein